MVLKNLTIDVNWVRVREEQIREHEIIRYIIGLGSERLDLKKVELNWVRVAEE